MPLFATEVTTGVSAGKQMNDALMRDVNPNNLANQFVELMPWIGLMVVVCFAIYEVRRLIKGGSKGKVKC